MREEDGCTKKSSLSSKGGISEMESQKFVDIFRRSTNDDFRST